MRRGRHKKDRYREGSRRIMEEEEDGKEDEEEEEEKEEVELKGYSRMHRSA